MKIQALTIDLETASTEKSNVNEEMYQLTVSRDEAIVKADSLKLELQLLKALYVLKQAGRVWNLQLNQLLIETGFVPTTADPCVYVYRRVGTLIVLAIHVDDGLIAYNNKKELQVILDKLHKKYRLKDLGQPSKFLGCHIKQEPDGTIKLHQKLYIEEIAQRFGMINSNPTQTPYLSGLNYDKNELKSTTLEESIRMKSYPVRALQGCLRFAAEWTHPEILEPLGKLCKHMESPSYRLWEAGNEILRYLNSVKEEGLSYKRDGNILPEGYIDADWAGCNDNDNDARKSTSSLVILLANAPITTKCKPQNCVSLSSTEAEYVATTLAAQEIIWLRRLLIDMEFLECQEPTKLYEDNESCIKLAENNRIDARTKHIDIKYHFIRQAIREKHLSSLQSIDTLIQPADLFTKQHSTVRFKKLKALIGVY